MSRAIRSILWFMAATLAATAARAQSDAVQVALEQFGFRSVYRPGDFTPIRLNLINSGDEQMAVHVSLEVPEALGDIIEYTRPNVPLTPGAPVSVWLYVRLLPTVDDGTIWTVRVYRDDDGERGAEVGSARISPGTALAPAQMVSAGTGLIAIIGGGQMAALPDYSIAEEGRTGTPITGHEPTGIVAGAGPNDIPDRWEGLDSFEAMVWTDAQPGSISLGSGSALRQWIERGGHFIIVLPTDTNDWNIGTIANNPLHDLLPTTLPPVTTIRLRELIPVISKRQPQSIPDTEAQNIDVAIRFFDPPFADWQPLVGLPDNRTLAIQRRYGFGRISIIGFEVHSGQLSATALRIADGGGGVLEGDAFWNRILGRRVNTLSRPQIQYLDDNDQLRPNRSFQRTAFRRGDLVLEMIRLRGQAATGLGFAVLLFLGYWGLAAGGFFLLKSRNLVRHSWLAFVATSAVFTFVAWGGVKLLSIKNVQVRHLSVADFIALPPDMAAPDEARYQRVTSWFTVFLPGYGEPRLSLDTEAGVRNILAPFTAPGADQTRFRNIDRYEIPIDSPHDYTVPARATTKEMYARWMGPPDAAVSSMFSVTQPIECEVREGTARWSGAISCDLPADVTRVRIYLVQPRMPARVKYSANDPSGSQVTLSHLPGVPYIGGVAVPTAGTLRTGTVINLAEVALATTNLQQSLDNLSRNVASYTDTAIGGLGEQELRDSLEALTFFHMLTPPAYHRPRGVVDSDNPPDFDRELARELDLSGWLVRPCVIITGFLPAADLPLPFRVNGEAPGSDGLTFIRWIHPLPMPPEGAGVRPDRDN